MKFSTPIVLAAAAAVASAELSLGDDWTWTRTITNNDMTYTKKGTTKYTGQPTTEPTSGTYTNTVTFVNDGSTRYKYVTNTYGQVTTITTDHVVSGPDETYTRPFVNAMHTSEVPSFLSSHSKHVSEASEADEFTAKHGTDAAKSHDKFKSELKTGSSGNAGNALQYGAGLGAFGAVAALLL